MHSNTNSDSDHVLEVLDTLELLESGGREDKPKPDGSRGEVYVISARLKGAPDGALYAKIGYTTRGAKQRFEDMKTGIPPMLIDYDFEVSLRTRFPRRLESILHYLFAERRAEREWFSLDQRDIDVLKGDPFGKALPGYVHRGIGRRDISKRMTEEHFPWNKLPLPPRSMIQSNYQPRTNTKEMDYKSRLKRVKDIQQHIQNERPS